MMAKRVGLAVWLNNIKMARHLRRFGNVHYISRKMRYAILYIDADKREELVQRIEQFNFVKKVDASHLSEIKTEYQGLTEESKRELKQYQLSIQA